jgi:hypothetical protein
VKISINDAAADNLYSKVMQEQMTETAQLLELDLYKLGYRVSGTKFIVADSTEIKFLSDLDNNGTSEQIHYYCGDSKTLALTSNPNDFPLIRILNNNKVGTSIAVVNFKLTYLDSLGQKLDYKSLSSQTVMNKIKSVKVNLYCETGEKVNDCYEAVEWERTISPKNI